MTEKAALVLSGGGALGAAHIGAVKVLQKKEYEFDFFAGVSAGSIVASLLACGKTAIEIEKILNELKLFSLAFDFSSTNFGLLRGKKIIKLFDDLFENKNIEDLKSPLLIGVTDFVNGERVIISQGKISDAVRCSISVPVLFEPIYHELEKRWLVDGGLSQNLPLDLAIEKYKGNKILSIDVAGNFSQDVNFGEKRKLFRLSSFKKTLERTFRIMYKNQQTHFPKDNRVVKILPNLSGFTASDIFKLKKITKKGEEAAELVVNTKL